MAISYAARVRKAVNYMFARLGSTITYKRFHSAGQWTPTGVTDIYWEQTSITAIVHTATDRDSEETGGRIRLGDKAFLFLASDLTDHSDYYYIKFTSGSVEFTAGETITGAISGKTAVVVNWYEDSGTWAGGNATGVVWVSSPSGSFNASENLNGSVGGTNIATTTSTNTSGGTDSVDPRVGDIIVYGGENFYLEMEGMQPELRGGAVVREDITETTFTVWARAKNA